VLYTPTHLSQGLLDRLAPMQEEYNRHKSSIAENLIFNETIVTIPFEPLQVVQVYFKTATFDSIEKDVKVTLEAQLGVVGGTMGLFTGFSVLSAVEIVFFIGKFFMSTLRKNSTS
jgi:hypothetical protein